MVSDTALALPRILCLHGGGVNAAIFRIQLRAFLNHAKLKDRFRFVFVDAPFLCDAGVGVEAVYSDYGPYRRWFRWLSTHPEVDPEVCRQEIDYAIDNAISEDAGTGRWVGIIGFSQGAKLAASMLYQQQLEGRNGPWQFAALFAGRAPFVALSEESESFPWMQTAGGMADQADFDSILDRPEMKLRIPSLHVHGLKDEGLHLHKLCLENYCAPLTTTLVEWDGNHRLPLKKSDVDKVIDAIESLVDEYGISA